MLLTQMMLPSVNDVVLCTNDVAVANESKMLDKNYLSIIFFRLGVDK